MSECFRCGIDSEKALLYEAITPEGVQQICRKCSHKESVPLMKNKDILELKEFEKKQDIYERISRDSGVDTKKRLNQRSLVLEKEEVGLRNLIEKNVCRGLDEKAKPREDLIKNFHWMIKRVRRLKHLTSKQFAEKIGEIQKTIDLAEQGVVPEGHDLIRKIEHSLGIRLIKEETSPPLSLTNEPAGSKNEEAKELKFDNVSAKVLTLSDLQEMKAREGAKADDDQPEFVSAQEAEKEADRVFEENKAETIDPKPDDEPLEKVPKTDEEKKELSKEEMDDLIFGRR